MLLVGVVSRGLAAERVPWGNMYEFGCVAILVALTAYIVLVRVWSIDWVGPMITGFGTVVLGASMLVYVPAGPLVPALHSYWLVIHVLGAIIAGSAFLVGAAASVLFLVKSRAEANTPVEARSGFLWRIPSSAAIDQVAYRVHAFAFPIWTFAALAGAIWAESAWGRYWGWDPKEAWAFITWVVYAGYLHARATAGWKGKAAAISPSSASRRSCSTSSASTSSSAACTRTPSNCLTMATIVGHVGVRIEADGLLMRYGEGGRGRRGEVRGRAGRVLRPARAERRRQDHDARDDRGPARRRPARSHRSAGAWPTRPPAAPDRRPAAVVRFFNA